jgi:predicted ferric reductase
MPVTAASFDPEVRRGRQPVEAEPEQSRRWQADLAVVLAGIGVGVTTALSLTAETRGQLSAAGGVAIFVGSITGFVGTYLALLMLLLISRLPFVESVLGLDGMIRWHRRLGPWPLTLITAHVLLVTVGYAQAAHSGLGREARTLLSSYPDILIATVGFALLLAAAVTSISAIRRRLARETWWLIHLGLYLALALSFAHVLVLGPSFVGHPLTRLVWSLVWLATAGSVLSFRVVLPLVRSLRHQLRVTEVRNEGGGAVSIVVAGRRLDRLAARGGQFMLWRFLTPGLWWQAHPYSLSALPHPPYLRLTVKAVGDHSRALAALTPGVRVAIEGPYGVFTGRSRSRAGAVLIAGGIGVTAVRSLLEDLPRSANPIVILRATRADDLVLRQEVASLVTQRRGRLHELVGERAEVRLDAKLLAALAPEIHQRDVYVSGPPAFVDHVVGLAWSLGVPDSAVHHEAYSL